MAMSLSAVRPRSVSVRASCTPAPAPIRAMVGVATGTAVMASMASGRMARKASRKLSKALTPMSISRRTRGKFKLMHRSTQPRRAKHRAVVAQRDPVQRSPIAVTSSAQRTLAPGSATYGSFPHEFVPCALLAVYIRPSAASGEESRASHPSSTQPNTAYGTRVNPSRVDQSLLNEMSRLRQMVEALELHLGPVSPANKHLTQRERQFLSYPLLSYLLLHDARARSWPQPAHARAARRAAYNSSVAYLFLHCSLPAPLS